MSADGQTPLTGQLKSNLTAVPAYSASADATTGFGSSVVGEADIFASGSKIVSVTSTTTTVNNNIVVNGSLTATSTNFSGTGEVGLPSGTSGQRPGSPVTGGTRFNTTNNNLETFDGTEWQSASQLTTAYTITASVVSNILTVNILNALTASAPTVADPLAIRFRDVTLATGDQTAVVVNSALTINTNATGATLGTTNGVPFRFWIVAFNNAGTAVLGLINCSTSTQIFPLNETTLQSSTAISAAATSAGVFYTPNGTTVSSKAFKILGYLEYSAGLGTAGFYASTPTTLQILNSAIPKPSEIVQNVYVLDTTPLLTTSVSPTIYVSNTITPTNTINPILVNVTGCHQVANSTNQMTTQIYRANTALGGVGTYAPGVSGANEIFALSVLDTPNSTSALTYSLKFASNSGNNVTTNNATLLLQEIMG